MTSLLSDKRFWLTSVERAVLTSAQTFAAELAVFSAVEVKEKGLEGLPWYAMTSVAVVAGLLSFLSSIGKGSSGSAGYKVELSKDSTPEEVPPGESFPEEREAPEADPEPEPEPEPEQEHLPLPDEAPHRDDVDRKKNPSKQGKGGSKKSK